MGDIIGKEGAELFIVKGAALVPLSKYKLLLKDNSDIILYGRCVNPVRGLGERLVLKHKEHLS